jgi:hypothetical protein
MTVVRSLAGLDGMLAVHVHALTEPRLRSAEERHRSRWGEEGFFLHDCFWAWSGQVLRTRLARDGAASPLPIVTLVRDPIARNVSSFFGRGGHRLAATDEELVALFVERFDHDAVLRWFDDDFGPTLGVDVYSTPFPSERGYRIYDAPGARVLVVRTENLRAGGANALQELVGAEVRPLAEANVGAERAGGDVYRRFVATARLPASYVDRM